MNILRMLVGQANCHPSEPLCQNTRLLNLKLLEMGYSWYNWHKQFQNSGQVGSIEMLLGNRRKCSGVFLQVLPWLLCCSIIFLLWNSCLKLPKTCACWQEASKRNAPGFLSYEWEEKVWVLWGITAFMSASKELILCRLHNAENSTYVARSLSSIVDPGHKTKKGKDTAYF